jgi:hypothetical protein
MRITHQGNSYRPGDYWRECPECGFDYLRSEMVIRWDGLLVCMADNDERNPQATPRYNHNHPLFKAEGRGLSIMPETDVIEDAIYSQDNEYIYDQDGNVIVGQG